jgi:hypothetical protein
MAVHDELAHEHTPWPDGPLDLLSDLRAWTVASLVAAIAIARRLRRRVA